MRFCKVIWFLLLFAFSGKHSNILENQRTAENGLSKELGHNGPCTDDNNYTPLLRTNGDSAQQSYMPLRFEKNAHVHEPDGCDYEVVETAASERCKDDATKVLQGIQLKNVAVGSQKEIYDDVAPEPMYLVLKEEEPSQQNKEFPMCRKVPSQPGNEGYHPLCISMVTQKNDDSTPEPMYLVLKEEASSELIENTPVPEKPASQTTTDGYLVPSLPMNEQENAQEPMYLEIKQVDSTNAVSGTSSSQTSVDGYLVPSLSTTTQKKVKNNEVKILQTADVIYSLADYIDPNPVNPDHVIPVCMTSQQH